MGSAQLCKESKYLPLVEHISSESVWSANLFTIMVGVRGFIGVSVHKTFRAFGILQKKCFSTEQKFSHYCCTLLLRNIFISKFHQLEQGSSLHKNKPVVLLNCLYVSFPVLVSNLSVSFSTQSIDSPGMGIMLFNFYLL